MSEDVYCEQFDEQQLVGIAQYFEAAFENPQPLASQMEILTEQLKNPRQKIIQVDCLRTRSIIFSDQIKKQLERMITHYVRYNNMEYKQGLNQIAAPFIYLRKANVPINKCEIYFHLFFKGYCMNFYDDNDFNSIDLFVRMFSLVLKYHDPGLHRYLNWYNVEPQIFCIGWLMTLFANKVSLRMVYTLWQFLITEKDKFLLFFLVLGIVIANKQNIIQTKNAHILTTVTNLIFKNESELQNTIKRSLILRKNTPNSLVKFFRDRMVFQKRRSFEDIHVLVSHLQKLQYFLVLPTEMSLQLHIKGGLCKKDCYLCDLWKPVKIPQIKSKINEQVIKLIEASNDLRMMKYFKEFVLVDLRVDKTAKVIYHGQIFKVDIERDIKQVEEEFLGKYIEEKSKKHFVFMLSEFNFEAQELSNKNQLLFCKNLLNSLISFSFSLLGMLQGGFHAFVSYYVEPQEYQPDNQIEPQSNFQSKLIKLPLQLQLKFSQKFQFGGQTNLGRYNVFVGLIQTLIIFDNILIIIENTKQVNQFLNYMRNNQSTLAYLFDHPNSPQTIQIFFILPLKKLKKASMKVHNHNILVLCYDSCIHTQSSIFKNLKSMMRFNIHDTLALNKICKECKVGKKKIILEMQSHEEVMQCVKTLKHSYSVMNKKTKLIINQFI